MGLSTSEIVGIGIISTAVILLIFFFIMAAHGASLNKTRSLNTNVSRIPTATSPKLQIASLPFTGAVQGDSQPKILYHGTALDKAIEIHETGLWLVGGLPPYAVWMSNCIDVAKGYSGSDGGVVVIQVDSNIKLTNRGGGVYIYEIPEAEPYNTYYKVAGLTPISVISPQGETIK